MSQKIIEHRSSPGLLRICLHCGKFFALKKIGTEPYGTVNFKYIFHCKFCGDTSEYFKYPSHIKNESELKEWKILNES